MFGIAQISSILNEMQDRINILIGSNSALYNKVIFLEQMHDPAILAVLDEFEKLEGYRPRHKGFDKFDTMAYRSDESQCTFTSIGEVEKYVLEKKARMFDMQMDRQSAGLDQKRKK